MVTAGTTQSELALQMERRRRSLRMSRSVLAQRSGVSLPTVNRVLSGDENATYATLQSIAQALGLNFELKPTASDQDYAEQQAREKAERIARMVQATSALECQAVDRETFDEMVRQTVHELMAGSRRRLWSL